MPQVVVGLRVGRPRSHGIDAEKKIVGNVLHKLEGKVDDGTKVPVRSRIIQYLILGILCLSTTVYIV
jgi:hypothetical protein